MSPGRHHKLVVRGLDKLAVLLNYILQPTPALLDVTRDTSRQTNIIVGVHVDLGPNKEECYILP